MPVTDRFAPCPVQNQSIAGANSRESAHLAANGQNRVSPWQIRDRTNFGLEKARFLKSVHAEISGIVEWTEHRKTAVKRAGSRRNSLLS